ncbi:hypothetical protein N658DRAFT_305608 [Parathielavia hyrcaniae]|uniref:Uncharacterized protein n=1 Tax=Parathielavia hyrcaniae TaxID=113614 RepID=A0AAN6T3A3_9PEZI|nr:hypothetical protein N658DRAFT_305608 [Parathielavia hyrcaniae]
MCPLTPQTRFTVRGSDLTTAYPNLGPIPSLNSLPAIVRSHSRPKPPVCGISGPEHRVWQTQNNTSQPPVVSGPPRRKFQPNQLYCSRHFRVGPSSPHGPAVTKGFPLAFSFRPASASFFAVQVLTGCGLLSLLSWSSVRGWNFPANLGSPLTGSRQLLAARFAAAHSEYHLDRDPTRRMDVPPPYIEARAMQSLARHPLRPRTIELRPAALFGFAILGVGVGSRVGAISTLQS